MAGGSVGASGAEVDGVPGGSGYSRRSENYPRSGKETSLYDNITWNGSASYSDGGAGGGGAGGSSGNSNGSPGGNASYGTWSKVVNLGFVTSSKLTSSVSGSGGRGANGAPEKPTARQVLAEAEVAEEGLMETVQFPPNSQRHPKIKAQAL